METSLPSSSALVVITALWLVAYRFGLHWRRIRTAGTVREPGVLQAERWQLQGYASMLASSVVMAGGFLCGAGALFIT